MAYEELIKKLSPTLKKICHKLNGRFTFFNDEDLYQEAIMHLWLDFKAGKLSDKTDSYILQGCYFHLKNYLRKAEDKASLISLEAKLDEDGRRFEETLCLENPETCFETIENRDLIKEIQNDGLTEKEKTVLSLCLDGLTTREIGKRLGISHVMVVKLNQRIKDKCKKFKMEF